MLKMLLWLAYAPAIAREPEPAAADSGAQFQNDLARARQEIAALRATGVEMQHSLDARDAALAELRGRLDALLAAAAERAEQLATERDRPVARIAVLERRLAELPPTANLKPAMAADAAVELAVLKAKPPTPAGKPAVLPAAKYTAG